MPGTGTQMPVCFLSLDFTFFKHMDKHTQSVHLIVIVWLIKTKSVRLSKIKNKLKKNKNHTQACTNTFWMNLPHSY